jgi:polysaccharide deacetylase 2 family uncharacterized protein YibQ
MIRRQDARQAAGMRQPKGRSRARLALWWFWVVVLGGIFAGAAVLQVLGPPPPRADDVAAGTAPVAAPRPSPAALPRRPAPAASDAPAAVIAAPLASLQEAAPEFEGAMLPRIGPNGQMPMQVYAARFDAADKRPRVAVLLAGVGMAETDSQEAMRATQASVSLAISPYAARPGHLLELARATGHETLISIPMEPLGYPLNDAGSHALLTGLSPAENLDRLVWALSRIAGYVGATAAMSGLSGERFAANQQMTPVLDELTARGLLYVDPRPLPVRPGGPPPVRPGVRVADVVIDDPPLRAEIEAKLARLEQIARDRGSALGVAGLPAPVTVERLSAWGSTVGMRGLALVPVSALVPPPSQPVSETAASPPR